MINTRFSKWLCIRESLVNEYDLNGSQVDPFITLHQKSGDLVYFGIHDLAKSYRENNVLPELNQQEIADKLGQIVDADPVDQTVTVQTHQAPWHYGYKKLEDKRTRDKRKQMSQDPSEQAQVKIPVKSLMPITHMMKGSQSNLWLVIDASTKYQEGLIREIRKKEFERAQGIPQQVANTPMNQPVNQQHVAVDQNTKDRFLMQGRNIMHNPQFKPEMPMMPMNINNEFEGFDPTILSYDRYWKIHNDTKKYRYYPQS